MGRPMRSVQRSADPKVQQQKKRTVQICKLLSDGQITDLRIHVCRFDDGRGQSFGLGACTVYRSSHKSTRLPVWKVPPRAPFETEAALSAILISGTF